MKPWIDCAIETFAAILAAGLVSRALYELIWKREG